MTDAALKDRNNNNLDSGLFNLGFDFSPSDLGSTSGKESPHFSGSCKQTGKENTEHYKPSFQSPKKRKVDKDGFVTPATPDLKFRRHGHPSFARSASQSSKTVAEHKTSFTSSTDNDSLLSPDQSLDDTTNISQDSNHPHSAQGLGDEEDNSSLKDFLQELAEYSKEEVLKWSEVFRMSEEHEEKCVSQLEEMILQARALEGRLVKEKNLMRDRLMQICRTLQSV